MASINQQGNYMVKYDLNRLQTNTQRMQRAMPSSAPLPEWAKSKLTQARSHVANVANYQQSKLGSTLPQISGRQARAAILGALVGGTIIASRIEDVNFGFWESLNLGLGTAGIGSLWAGMFVVADGMRDDDINKIAIGGGLAGLGVAYSIPLLIDFIMMK